MKYTLGQASNETGISKPTLSRAIKKGDLSAEGGAGKPYQIDPSELGRWLQGYRDRNPKASVSETPNETHETPIRNSALQAEVDAIRKELEQGKVERERERNQLSATIEDLRTRLDAESAERRTLTAQLTDQRHVGAQEPRKGFWARLRG